MQTILLSFSSMPATLRVHSTPHVLRIILFHVQARRKAVIAARNRAGVPMLLSRHKGPAPDVKFGKNMRPATATLSLATGPALELS